MLMIWFPLLLRGSGAILQLQGDTRRIRSLVSGTGQFILAWHPFTLAAGDG